MNELFDIERFGANVAVVEQDREISYDEFAQAADEARSFVKPGDLVAIECNNSFPSLAAYIGCQRMNAPTLLVDAKLSADLRTSTYDRFLVSIVFDAVSGGWVRLRESGPRMNPDLALLLSTSGSTGAPKLVRLSAANLTANANSIADYLGIDQRERGITSLPLHYSYGLSVVHSHLWRGASLALTGLSLTDAAFWAFLRESRATSFAGVPVMYDWLRRLRFERMDLPHLRTLTQAGGRLSVDLVTWAAEIAARKNMRLFVMYGQTEATARMSYLRPELALLKPDSIGGPVPGGRLELVDEHGQLVQAAGVTGELIYRGRNVMMGYAMNADDLADGDVCSGRLATGDIGMCDHDGDFYIRGRKARFLKVFGNRIGLDDIEALLESRHCSVVATGRDDLLVLAGVDPSILKSSVGIIQDELRIHHSAIGQVTFAEIPRTNAGKVNYAQIMSAFDAMNLQKSVGTR